VIPVLVGGATTEEFKSLPPELSPLSLREAVELRDGSFQRDLEQLLSDIGRRRKRFKVVAACIAVVIALSILLLLGPLRSWQETHEKANQEAETARFEMQQGDYQRAFDRFANALKLAPGDTKIKNGQVDAAMRWTEHFSVLAAEGEKSEVLAAPLTAKLIDVLDSGLTREKVGTQRAADVLAHLGWAHWLNKKIAFKEFGSADENDLRQALNWDPKNVYANAMLANILLQTQGSIDEALAHFRIAEQSAKERQLVRTMELGGMHYRDEPQLEAAMIRIVNDMRKNGEVLDGGYRSDLVSKFDLHYWQRMRNTAQALPAEDAWETYQWLTKKQRDDATSPRNELASEFVHASILSAHGRTNEALAMFRDVQKKAHAKSAEGYLARESDEAMARLQKAQ
jgi:tetratricopeptide (TPR) repeat protein